MLLLNQRRCNRSQLAGPLVAGKIRFLACDDIGPEMGD